MVNLACFFLIFISGILALDPNIGVLISSDRWLTQNLFKQLRNQTGNFMFSAFSLQQDLLFLETGCKGQTAEEILQALQLQSVSNDALAKAIKDLIPFLFKSRNYTFKIANAIFVQENYTIKEDFQRNATEVFYAKTQNVDFAENTEAAKIINSCVGNQTNNKIKDLIEPNLLDGQTRVVLVNTLLFQGNWTFPFNPRYTKTNESFYKTPTDIIKVEMMVLEGKTFEYANCSSLKAQFLKLPIIGGNASMTIVLPTEQNGLANLEKSPDRIFTPQNLTRREVNVKLPKFLFRSAFNFNSNLKQLGVVKAFVSGQADLSGIAGQKGDLSVTDVTQKTYIKVSENGVEASAATAITTTKRASSGSPDATNFTCDRPFDFYFEVEGIIVFAGRVEDPSSDT